MNSWSLLCHKNHQPYLTAIQMEQKFNFVVTYISILANLQPLVTAIEAKSSEQNCSCNTSSVYLYKLIEYNCLCLIVESFKHVVKQGFSPLRMWFSIKQLQTVIKKQSISAFTFTTHNCRCTVPCVSFLAFVSVWRCGHYLALIGFWFRVKWNTLWTYWMRIFQSFQIKRCAGGLIPPVEEEHHQTPADHTNVQRSLDFHIQKIEPYHATPHKYLPIRDTFLHRKLMHLYIL